MTQHSTKKEGLKIVRNFNAPMTMVFEAFSQPENFAQWWGPAGSSITVIDFDFKANGRCYYKMEGNGQTMWALFRYGNISRYDLIEFTSSFSDAQGNISTSPFPMDFPLEVFNRITLEENDGITTLVLQGHPVNATPAQEETYYKITANMQQGFKGTFDQLDGYLNKIKG
jgi:uncharacterized protein YndB with AHSA1/START domain